MRLRKDNTLQENQGEVVKIKKVVRAMASARAMANARLIIINLIR